MWGIEIIATLFKQTVNNEIKAYSQPRLNKYVENCGKWKWILILNSYIYMYYYTLSYTLLSIYIYSTFPLLYNIYIIYKK